MQKTTLAPSAIPGRTYTFTAKETVALPIGLATTAFASKQPTITFASKQPVITFTVSGE